jgi:hypothetical protein
MNDFEFDWTPFVIVAVIFGFALAAICIGLFLGRLRAARTQRSSQSAIDTLGAKNTLGRSHSSGADSGSFIPLGRWWGSSRDSSTHEQHGRGHGDTGGASDAHDAAHAASVASASSSVESSWDSGGCAGGSDGGGGGD